MRGAKNQGPRTRVVGIVGPTCVGKTSVSIALAQEVDSEILSVDSRQIYKEISIGTAKPSQEEMAAVPHHFIGERSIADPITAAAFAESALERMSEIESRGKRVILVGGSTLYLHALLFGMDDVPPVNPDVRSALQARFDAEGLTGLVEELGRVDPSTHDRIDVANPRRVLRALEVYHTTGRPVSTFQSGERLTPRFPATLFVMDRERADLYGRINARVESMIDEGLIDEVKVILEAGFDSTLQALQTIGYREVAEFLSGGTDREIMVEAVKRNTRRYAKRQLTWFRRYPMFEWITVREDDAPSIVTTKLLKAVLYTGEG